MSIDQTTTTALEADLAELRGELARLPFPASQDDVLSALVRRRAPSRLLWRAGGAPRARRYHSLDDRCEQVARGDGHGSPPPPGW